MLSTSSPFPFTAPNFGGNSPEKLPTGSRVSIRFLFISSHPIKYQNVLLSERVEVWIPPNRGGGGGAVRVEFTHHRAAANRNPPSIGHIFICAVLCRTLSPLQPKPEHFIGILAPGDKAKNNSS